MKRFRFPMKSVATVRELAELRARESFAQAIAVVTKAEELLAEVRRRMEELREIVVAGRLQSFRPRDHVAFLEAYHAEHRHEIEARHAVVAATNVLEQRRQDWLEARRALKLIRNLEARARTVHRSAAEHESQRELDELAGRSRALVRL
ncbi:MAG: flagellar FliJ family protein [Opitutae bacterium]|nr:flagellar FliJ family protein [Opitutae bacterium]